MLLWNEEEFCDELDAETDDEWAIEFL